MDSVNKKKIKSPSKSGEKDNQRNKRENGSQVQAREDSKLDKKKVEELLARNLSLEKELGDFQKKLTENEDFTLRLRADFDNYRKRTMDEKDRILSNAGEGIFKNFLKIYDSYTKALDGEITNQANQAFLKGFKLIKKEMDKFLEEHKVIASTQIGDDFNPNIHQAIFFEETNKTDKEKVMEVFQQGYLMNGRLLREAMVKVEKPKFLEISEKLGASNLASGNNVEEINETEFGKDENISQS